MTTICALCCCPFPLSKGRKRACNLPPVLFKLVKVSSGQDKAVKVTTRDLVAKWVCGGCLGTLKQVVERREEVVNLEERVRGLQLKILRLTREVVRLLGELEGIGGEFGKEVGEMEGRIGERGRLERWFEEEKGGEGGLEEVIGFRMKILEAFSVIREVKEFPSLMNNPLGSFPVIKEEVDIIDGGTSGAIDDEDTWVPPQMEEDDNDDDWIPQQHWMDVKDDWVPPEEKEDDVWLPSDKEEEDDDEWKPPEDEKKEEREVRSLKRGIKKTKAEIRLAIANGGMEGKEGWTADEKEEDDDEWQPKADDDWVPSDNEKEEDDKEDARAVRPLKRGGRKAIIQSALANSGMLPKLRPMSRYKRNIILRALKRMERAKQGLEPPTLIDDVDPSKAHLLTYDHSTDTLNLAGYQLTINGTNRCVQCSACGQQLKAFKGQKTVKDDTDRKVYNHVLGFHLNLFQCPHCPVPITDLLTFQRHVLGHRNAWICDICGKPLKRKFVLENHRWTHMNLEEKQEALRSGMKRPTKPKKLGLQCRCPTCGKDCHTMANFKRHLKTHQEPEEICPWCGKCFRNMNYHKRFVCYPGKMEGVKKETLYRFECNFCLKKFPTLSFLKLHKAGKHSEERPHQCELCGKMFKTKGEVTNHLRTHEDVRRFKCGGGCGKKYKKKKNLKEHEKKCEMIRNLERGLVQNGGTVNLGSGSGGGGEGELPGAQIIQYSSGNEIQK